MDGVWPDAERALLRKRQRAIRELALNLVCGCDREVHQHVSQAVIDGSLKHVLGKDIDETVLQSFLSVPEVKRCFPPNWRWDQPVCGCFPRINVRGAAQPYADRVVFIGDCGVSRLYKDGIGAAYRAAKAAATTAIFEGISADDFKRRYDPACRQIETDNGFGRVIFAVTHLIQRICFSRRAILRMTSREQRSRAGSPNMSSVLWDTFTGSAPYREIFFRTLHPAFWSRLFWNMAASLVDGS